MRFNDRKCYTYKKCSKIKTYKDVKGMSVKLTL